MTIHETGLDPTQIPDHPGELTDELEAALPTVLDGTSIPVISEEEMLKREFRLDLSDHELRDPVRTEADKPFVGTVTSIEPQLPVSELGEPLPDGVKVYEVKVVDPYVEADTGAYEIVRDYVEHMEGMMARAGYDPLAKIDETTTARSEASTEAEWNPFTTAWLTDQNAEGLAEWRRKVPSGRALQDIYDIPVGKVIATRDGREITASPETTAQLRFVDDAVAIRDRAAAMREIAEAYIPGINLENGRPLRWLSLASGTATPSIQALAHARDQLGINSKLVVADLDRDALAQVADNAASYGFTDEQITIALANILKSDDLTQRLLRKAKEEQFDVVENLGFQEYLPQQGDTMDAMKRMNLLQASEFTRDAFSRVAPGGILISGNMVYDRPQAKYVFGVVDWPIINARYEKEIMNVYKEAGILDDPQAEVAMFRIVNQTTKAHLYNIVVVYKKPLADSISETAA